MENKNVSDLVIRHVMTVTDKEFADLSVGTLAYSFKIDRYKLSRQFKRQTAMTLEDFLLKEKMTRSAFLLKAQREITVKEVSQRIGFCTSDYFIRKFRKFFGIAPGRYKEFKNGDDHHLKQERKGEHNGRH
jgi:AraC family transcriptional regulator